ncbi:dTDP-glucose 4,6-dehydratase [Lentibacillus sp. JNUCC-1]|uniref:dTDP-glucose 4,6-dehydratase n=1 Tax=Lentibacillus sp. JNUCC-1 TaxID=2654513 RepID=UPI0012E8B47A|nr:dTDP-glucose 4,6-dehydratase [Lentibacillus sp. JNUCC-1]MUV36482.1 dTDP-glucose 4,6-dehydratase [Lentibacillus sp. JNUCC-1]
MKKQPTLLVTGGAGFIGSNFIVNYMKQHPDVHILNIDILTYAGDPSHLSSVDDLERYQFIQGDITNEKLINVIFTEFNIIGVVHFAAESHVDRSIKNATEFVQTNVVGTLTLLQAARQAWEQEGTLQTNRFHHISTDEVYGSIEGDGKFNEESPYDPRNPYSASKAGANMMVQSFGYTYGMNVVISGCSNNYGPRQHEEKLIPTIISNALKGERIPIYGDGRHVRDWLHVEDHCQALEMIFHHAEPMSTYTIGGNNERTNIEVATKICDVLDRERPDLLETYEISTFKDLIMYTIDRQGHDRRYAIDASKLQHELGWEPKITLDQGLEQTVKWYIDKWTAKKV